MRNGHSLDKGSLDRGLYVGLIGLIPPGRQ